MQNNLPQAQKWLALLGALAYAALVCAGVLWFLPGSRAVGPILMIALGLPLVLRLVPRNYLYGMRSPATLWTTKERWYRQNVITGVVMVLVGTVWLIVLAVR